MVSVSKSTKVLRFATPGRLFASCHFETPAHPQATNATFRWAKRVSTVSTYFPHFEPAICHILSQRFPTFSTYSTVSKLRQMSRFATPMRSAPSQTQVTTGTPLGRGTEIDLRLKMFASKIRVKTSNVANSTRQRPAPTTYTAMAIPNGQRKRVPHRCAERHYAAEAAGG